MNEISDLIRRWQEFVDRYNRSNEKKIQLNPDRKKVEFVAQSVLANEKNKGFKLCPCKVIIGNTEENLKIVCPCNFFIQSNWKDRGDCWCSLFVKG